MQSEQNVFIQGEAGQLDIKHRPASDHQIGLLMCHPHPLFQGTMDNKVVTTVTRAAAELGLPTLRFNFRGVGKSEGEHDNGRGEQRDVLSVIKYAKEQLGWQKIILAGFSFGAGMACLAACEAPETVAKLLLVAPPVHHFDAPSQLPFEFETYVLMGNADDVVPFDEVEDWVARIVPAPHMYIYEDAGHFFHGRLVELKDTVQSIINAGLQQ